METEATMPRSHDQEGSRPAPARVALSPRARRDRAAGRLFLAATALPLIGILALVIALAARSWPILQIQSVGALLAGETWHPLQGHFGLLPFIAGTVWVTVLAILLALPPCLLCGIYLAEYAHPSVRAIMKPMLDLLAGIPSVVYGVWGILAVVPFVQDIAAPVLSRGLGWMALFRADNPTGYGVLAAGVVLAVMVTPVIISVIGEVLEAVPAGLREASLALGATRWQTVKWVVLRKSAPGIVAGVVLGFSRAFGETLAVMMVVGNVPIIPKSIFDPAYPLTALIANNYGEMMSIPQYDAALMSAALVLLLVVVGFNLLSALFLQRVIARDAA